MLYPVLRVCTACHVLLADYAWNVNPAQCEISAQWTVLNNIPFPPLTDLADDQIQSWPRGIIPYNMSDDLTGGLTHACHTSHVCSM